MPTDAIDIKLPTEPSPNQDVFILLFASPGASFSSVQPLPSKAVEQLASCVPGAADLQNRQASTDLCHRHRHGASGRDHAGVADTQLPEGTGGLQNHGLQSSRA